MKKILSTLLLSAIVGCFSIGQNASTNVFLNRSYWTSNPSVTQISADIAQGNSPSAFNQHKFDAVTWAILEDTDTKTVAFLLSLQGNDVNKRAHDGRTPIFWAAYRGNIELMQSLIKKGAKTDLLDDYGNSVVNFAANTGITDPAIYEICVANGVRLQNEINKDGATPVLLVMPFVQTLEIVNYFVSSGLSLHTTDKAGNNAIVYAAKTGNTFMIDYLINLGLDPNANNGTAVLFACAGARGKAIELRTFSYLSTLDISFDAVNDKGQNALHLLAAKTDKSEIFTFFKTQHVDFNRPDSAGNLPITYAVADNSASTVQLLAEFTEDINFTNHIGNNLFHIAAQRGDEGIAKTILELGVAINVQNTDGLSPLHIAAMRATDVSILAFLVRSGADKSLKTGFDESAFQLALENEQLSNHSDALLFLK